MNQLDQLVPKIKRNLKQFNKPGVLFVRPGYCFEKGWPTKEEAIVAVTSASAKKVKLPPKIEGTPVEVRAASDLEQFSHDHPAQFSRLRNTGPSLGAADSHNSAHPRRASIRPSAQTLPPPGTQKYRSSTSPPLFP